MKYNITECLKWKYDPGEYLINRNKSVTVKYKHSSITLSKNEYFLNNKSYLFWCVPSELQPPFYYTDLLCAFECLVSSIFLIMSTLIHCLKSNINANRALVCHEISLTALYLTLFLYALAGWNMTVLYVCTYFAPYISRSAFCWLVVINYDKWKQLRPENIAKISTSTLTFCLQSAFAWLFPALIIAVTLLLERLGAETNSIDMAFHQNYAQVIVMYGSTEGILVVNIVLFILTVRNLRRCGKSISLANEKIFRQLSVVYLKLMTVTGLIWIISVIEWALEQQQPHPYWTVVDVVYSLQGFLIFLVYHAPRTKSTKCCFKCPSRLDFS